MRTLGWMQKRFWKKDEQSTIVSMGKSYSCFSALWELDEQRHYPKVNNNLAQFRHPVALEAHGVETVKEEIVEMKPWFFHGLLAIGTLGSVITTKDPITTEPAKDEDEINAGEQILNKKLENLTEKELEKDTKENTIVYPLKEYYEMPALKADEKEEKAALEHTIKKIATSYKRSGKLEKGVKRETKVFHFMKKMLKKLDFTSRCSTSTAFCTNAIICDSTEKTSTKVLRRSKKIHPEGADIHVNKSHNYEVKKMWYDESYDEKVTSDDEDDMYYQDGMFKKETISSTMVVHRSFNIQPAERKAHWIKTDADYFVLEF